MFPLILASAAAAATSIASEPTQSSWLPGTVIAALVAATASFIAASIAAAASLWTTHKNTQTQFLLKNIDEANNRRTGMEERAHALRSEHYSPFFTDLLRNLNLARDVRLHVNNVRRCPLSPAFKRRLLASSNVVSAWGESGVELSEHTAKVFLAIDMTSANTFSSELDGLIRYQMDIVKKLAESFEFNDEGFKTLDESFAEYRRLAANLWISTRKAIVHSQHIDDGQMTWSIEGLGAAISGVASKLKFQFQNSASSWSVWWRIAKSPGSEATYDSFCLERDRLIAAVAELPGVLAIQTENEADGQEFHSLLTIRFASEPTLKKFCDELLPQLKVQTKSLWDEAVTPQELMA